MKLEVYQVEGKRIDLRPAPATRNWMDATNNSYAYRCLPLNIANTHGWEVLCPAAFSAEWNGGRDLSAVTVEPEETVEEPPAVSHFGNGILTFRLKAIFRTEPGYDLMVQGPVNQPKDAISALSGIVETDWSPYSFTMNWLFTRAGARVSFARGEPICHFFPIKRGLVEEFDPQILSLSDDPQLKRNRDMWRADRERFLAELKQPDSPARAQKWQKHYYLGRQPDGTDAPLTDHRIKLRVKPFRDVSPSGKPE